MDIRWLHISFATEKGLGLPYLFYCKQFFRWQRFGPQLSKKNNLGWFIPKEWIYA